MCPEKQCFFGPGTPGQGGGRKVIKPFGLYTLSMFPFFAALAALAALLPVLISIPVAALLWRRIEHEQFWQASLKIDLQ